MTLTFLEPKWNAKQLVLNLDMNEVICTGPQALLFQVWTNLIENAIKFSANGGCIRIRLTHADAEIHVLISDDGIGMTEETMSHIFEKFYQGDSSRKEQGNGATFLVVLNW